MITGWNWYAEKNLTVPQMTARLIKEGFSEWGVDLNPISAPGKSYWMLQAGGVTTVDFAVSTKTLTRKDKDMALNLVLLRYGVELHET